VDCLCFEDMVGLGLFGEEVRDFELVRESLGRAWRIWESSEVKSGTRRLYNDFI